MVLNGTGEDRNPFGRRHGVMNRIVLGNLISFAASLALTAGCLMKDPKKVYMLQVTENLISGNVIS